MSSVGPTALFDLPWVPLYLAICFLFHFWIGVAALAGAILLCGLTLLTELRTREPTRLAGNHAASRNAFAEASRRNAEVVHAMGFSERIAERWSAINRDYLDAQARASDVTGALGTASRVLRLALQSGVLGIGAYLVIHQEASGGIMIAGSIILSRALAPIELSIAHWKGFVSARQSWGRLKSLLAAFPASAVSVALPQPGSALTVDGISVTPPGERRLVVHDISFMLTKGAGLAIIGPSASGKSSLARALAGVWQPAAGHVRLDGASLDQWDPAERGKHVGYLPQDVQLFDGTIAENIARFETNPPARKIIDAAKAAGVHGLIVGMREGYDTRVGESGSALSSGQRQRIALARALYDNPFLVVLDEPNSNLDADGEAALTEAIKGIRTRGGIAVVVAHRPSALAALDQILVLANGRAQAFGAKDEVLGAMSRPKTGHAPPLKIVPSTEAAGAS
jgi:PrtD family type I secretion system ABC transporter